MKLSPIIWGLIAVLFLVVGLYLIALFTKGKNKEQLDELETRKKVLFDLSIGSKVERIKKMTLAGQSQAAFQALEKRWIAISTNDYATLERQLFEAESLNSKFKFGKVKVLLAAATSKISQMETEAASVNEGLKDLSESEDRNSIDIQAALDKFEESKATLTKKPELFGPAAEPLTKQVEALDELFNRFKALNTSGDPIEAAVVLEKAEKDTWELVTLMSEIKPLFKTLSEDFPEQIDDLEQGYKKLVTEKYNFPNIDIRTELTKVKSKLEATTAELEKCETKVIEESCEGITNHIDRLYQIMEKEIEAKAFVAKNLVPMQELIEHSFQNNHQLVIEVDHVGQSYSLNNDEMGRAHGLQAHLEEIRKDYDRIITNANSENVVYSQIQEAIEVNNRMLDVIQDQQVSLNQALITLRDGEKLAQVKIEEFEFRLRNTKRRVDKQRLPGIPDGYIELFHVVTDRIEELSQELEELIIDMDEINELVQRCEADLKILDEKTDELVDSAALTEQMLQYANRYRLTHTEISEASEKSLYLFNREFRYKEALDEIGVALESVEPGAFKRIESFYYNEKK